MRTVLLVAAAFCSWAVTAHASDAYSDPNEFREPGVTVPTSAVTMTTMVNTDPFEMAAPGAAYGMSAVKMTTMVNQDPFEMAAPGVTYGTSGAPLTTQAAK